jgi:hypothetical protein
VVNFDQPSNRSEITALAADSYNSAKVTNTGVVVYNSGRRGLTTQIQVISAFAGDQNDPVAGTGQLFMDCELDLGKIPFTFFSCDRDFYANEPLELMVEFEGYDNYFFQSDTANNLNNSTTLTNAVDFPSIFNYELRLAVEVNNEIKNSIISRVMTQGLDMVVPCSYLYRFPIGVGTSFQVSQKINSGHGKRLLRVISSPSLTNDRLNTRCNFYNIGAVKHIDFYTTLNDTRLEEITLNSLNGDDWFYSKNLLSGSPFENRAEYYSQCPSYVNDFSACGSLVNSKENDQTINGMAIDPSQELTWCKMIINKSVSDTTENVIVVCQKNLVSTSSGVQLV